jgi:hypothetical protein
MKHLICLLLNLSSISLTKAQPPVPAPALPSDYHSHSGFHFEFGIGPAFGTINDKYAGYDIKFSGTGAAIDIKIGGAVDENLFLTFDMLSKAIVSPEITAGGITYPTSNEASLSEVTYGAGLTHYVMPTDIFLSITVGGGTFLISDDQQTTRSKFGISAQFKMGKHWWISKAWGISLSGSYGFTSVNNTGTSYYSEKLKSNRYTVMVAIGYH